MGRPLGQHFLSDEQVLQKIVDAITHMLQEHSLRTMREIGPGQGALTQYIHGLVDNFVCFEKDAGMKKHLGQFLQQEQIVRGDVLEQDIHVLPHAGEKKLVVGNLPYYITSPILRKFFELPGDASPLGGVFLIQKEVAEKVMTTAKKKSYLRWLLNYMYDVEYLFTVAPEAFNPPPKVDSAVIALTKKDENDVPSIDYTKLLEFLDIVSPFKRKTLGKIGKMRTEELKKISAVFPEALQGKRLEELGWEEIREILA